MSVLLFLVKCSYIGTLWCLLWNLCSGVLCSVTVTQSVILRVSKLQVVVCL